MLFQLFFSGFRTFRFGRCINRIDDHSLPLFSGREEFIGVCDSFFHKNAFLQDTKRALATDLATKTSIDLTTMGSEFNQYDNIYSLGLC